MTKALEPTQPNPHGCTAIPELIVTFKEFQATFPRVLAIGPRKPSKYVSNANV
jgi:hypothetical protein